MYKYSIYIYNKLKIKNNKIFITEGNKEELYHRKTNYKWEIWSPYSLIFKSLIFYL